MKAFRISLLAGFVAGLVVLGFGGRVVMRVLTVTTEAAPEFTVGGTLEVFGVGVGWGVLTAPLLLLVKRQQKLSGRGEGPVFGLLTLALAILLTGVTFGFDGIVAPGGLIVLSSVLFPGLFVLHGMVVAALTRRWA
jgi:hypothetical protein